MEGRWRTDVHAVDALRLAEEAVEVHHLCEGRARPALGDDRALRLFAKDAHPFGGLDEMQERVHDGLEVATVNMGARLRTQATYVGGGVDRAEVGEEKTRHDVFISAMACVGLVHEPLEHVRLVVERSTLDPEAKTT